MMTNDSVARLITIEIMKERAMSGAENSRTLQQWEDFIKRILESAQQQPASQALMAMVSAACQTVILSK